MGIEKPINIDIPTRCTQLNDTWKPLKDMWETKQNLNRISLWVLHGILEDVTTTIQKVWDEKENPRMYDEVFEGTRHGWKLGANLYDMVHSFVLQNVDIMVAWHL
jgi:hypothetical protein